MATEPVSQSQITIDIVVEIPSGLRHGEDAACYVPSVGVGDRSSVMLGLTLLLKE